MINKLYFIHSHIGDSLEITKKITTSLQICVWNLHFVDVPLEHRCYVVDLILNLKNDAFTITIFLKCTTMRFFNKKKNKMFSPNLQHAIRVTLLKNGL